MPSGWRGLVQRKSYLAPVVCAKPTALFRCHIYAHASRAAVVSVGWLVAVVVVAVGGSYRPLGARQRRERGAKREACRARCVRSVRWKAT